MNTSNEKTPQQNHDELIQALEAIAGEIQALNRYLQEVLPLIAL